jgi:hypothetical protein
MHEKFEYLKAESLKVRVFSDVTLGQLVNKPKYGRFEDTTILRNVVIIKRKGLTWQKACICYIIYILHVATRKPPLPQ